MNAFLKVLVLSSLAISCGQRTSVCETECIKTLELRVNMLEKELQKGQINDGISGDTQDSPGRGMKRKEYFTIGSTETEVLEVMGDPSSYIDLESTGKRFFYGASAVVFGEGRVVSYSNAQGNLKVKIRK